MPIAQDSRLTQIAFGSTRPGVAKPIARLRLDPTEIAEQFDLAFESAEDDLDAVDIASFSTRLGREFSLVRHRHQVERGTDILTDEKSVSITEDLADALKALRLGSEDLTWKHPDINEELLTLLCSMNAREESLKKLYDLQSHLSHSIEALTTYKAPSVVIDVLSNASAYVLTHLSRLRDWGSRNDLHNLDLIGYSTWCILEVDRTFRLDRGRYTDFLEAFDAVAGVSSWRHNHPSKLIASSLTAFDEEILRNSKELWEIRSARDRIATHSPLIDDTVLFSMYEKYAHAVPHIWVPSQLSQQSYVRDIFLDRAVRSTERIVFLLQLFARTVSETRTRR